MNKRITSVLMFLMMSICFFINGRGQQINAGQEKRIFKPGFQQILDSANLKGSILVYDEQRQIYFSNDFKWAEKGRLPASTFKIVNSIIGIEAGIIENEKSIFKWDGKKRKLAVWERDLNLKEAFQESCVPCYQEVARKIGFSRMQQYLKNLDYGNMQFDTTTVDLFWLEGNSKISQFQQIDFLKRFYFSKLPISKKTESIVKILLIVDKNNSYSLSGKSGWAMRDGYNNGWYVGYIEAENKVYFFAVNIDPKQNFDIDYFAQIRKEITLKALMQLRIIK
ncbi:MAG: class D beta-lactamase [Bacteroidetes bacterium]|nr:class D beta-lactamase [Bacteroidota bacterium]